MWQKCPICNGTGKTGEKLGYYSMEPNCPTCHGMRIISEINGLPPASVPASFNTPSTGDFRDANMESQDEYFGRK